MTYSRSDASTPLEVDAIVAELTAGIADVLGGTLAGLYLTGSLTYGDFDPGSSDIDYLAVLERPVTPVERSRLADLHATIAHRHPVWRERIEGSYVTRDMLGSVLPPAEGRPYINGGAFWDPDPGYGNEWLINLYALRACGVALLGPERDAMFPPVAIAAVREASRRDLLEEWVPKLDDAAFFASAHHQAYVTLTLCRVLHRAERDEVASKRVAAAWVMRRWPEAWLVALVESALRWRHGEALDAADEVRRLIRFTRERLDGS